MKVLVVDDEQANRLILQAMLKKSGHVVIEASNGEEAVRLFRQESPDIILMDVMMPVLDGYEATRQIKQETRSFVPIIFLTAITDEDALVECISSGGDDFLTKPYNRTILQAKIQAMERIRHLHETVTKQNRELEEYQGYLKREQEVAEQIFSKLMQQGEPDLPMICSYRQSAATFNGDILLVTRQPSGIIYMLVGDFTGHGLAAALGALPAAQIFYAMCNKGFSIEEILVEINQRLKQLLPTGMFLAATLMQLDPYSATATIWNGGFPDILILNDKNKIVSRIPSSHLPLGVVDHKVLSHAPERIQLEPGNRLIAYSDGVIETMNPAGEFYGQERFEELLVSKHFVGDCFVESFVEHLENFRAGYTQQDDVSFVEFVCDDSFFGVKKTAAANTSMIQPGNWELSFLFRDDTLHEIDPLPVLMSILRDIQGLHRYKEDLFLILSELYLNAVDYGVLGLNSREKLSNDAFENYYLARERKLHELQSGWVKIELYHKPVNSGGELTIVVEDSGPGFDHGNTPADMPETGIRGRGIALIKTLVKSMQYNSKGNRVEAVYEWR
ncbi:MAG: fused response regulator/phosphatase [Gammaproteobacteria bacterium]|nr:fused response regulator/phosphatase [Gammaproteobacteria bacterium]MDH5653883.1 fused response regulator/phosphatase [Gammaproteobacteria bacterium]